MGHHQSDQKAEERRKYRNLEHVVDAIIETRTLTALLQAVVEICYMRADQLRVLDAAHGGQPYDARVFAWEDVADQLTRAEARAQRAQI